MIHRIAAAPVALVILSGAVLAQEDRPMVGVSVEGTVVEIDVDLAAEACGLEAEVLLAEWETLGTELSTMADTSVQADATDLAPAVEVDTQMDSVVDGPAVTDGADATHEAGGEAAVDLASDGEAGVAEGEATAGTDTEPGSEPEVPSDGTMDAGVEATAEADIEAGSDDGAAVAEAGEDAGAMPATPTEGTVLSKAAVCEISRESADSLGIAVPG